MSAERPIRDLDYFVDLQVTILSIGENEIVDSLLQGVLNECYIDFQRLFRPASKQSEARKKVQSGSIILCETECTINKEFIDDALKLADSFDINELWAAQYLYIGTQTSTRYDRDPYSSAVYNYLSGLEIMYEILSYLVSLASDERIHGRASEVLLNFIHSFESGEKNFQELLYDRMKSIQNRIVSIMKTEKNTKILHDGFLESDHSFVLRSLLDQHENVCIISAAVCKFEPCKNSVILKVISNIKDNEHWNLLVSHQVLFLISAIQYCSSATIAQNHADPLTPEKAAPVYRNMLSDLRASRDWKCKPICAILQLVVSTELLGMCNNSEDIASEFDYEQELLPLVKAAITGNVFQHLITFKLFIQNDIQEKHPFSLFFSSNALSHYHVSDVAASNQKMLLVLEECLRLLCVSFIVHVADVLKEMRLAAEDIMLSHEIGDGVVAEVEDHSEDLFYGLVFTAFSTSSDEAYMFWRDKSSNLYGFLTWGSHAEVPSTIYAYFQMISGLTIGPLCSKAAVEFFDLEEQVSRVPHTLVPSTNTSWTFIFNSLQYYSQQLERKNDSQDYHDILELDRHNALILEAYLVSISSILTNVADTKVCVHLNKKFDAIAVLFKLLACRLPPELYSAILQLLGVISLSPDLRNIVWQYFEAWLGSIRPETLAGFTSVPNRHKQLEHRPLSSLTAFSTFAAESTVELVTCLTSMFTPTSDMPGSLMFPESLGDNSRYPGASDYVDFVWNCLMASQTADASLTLVQRVTVTFVCMRFFERCVTTLELDLINLSRLGVVDVVHAIPNSLTRYVSLHPGTRVLQQIGGLKHRQALLQIIKCHDTADISIRTLLIPVVSSTLRFITHVLARTDTFEEFVEPIVKAKIPKTGSLSLDLTRDTEFVVQLCMLASSSQTKYAQEALLLLSKCDALQLLDDRHFTILSSVDESKNILLGFISMAESPDDESESNTLRLLQLMVSNLSCSTKGRKSIVLAHFILGFASATAYDELNPGQDAGHIGSGRSMVHTLVAMLDRSSQAPEVETAKASKKLDLASTILLVLCEDEKTVRIVSPILQEAQFLHSQLQRQAAVEISIDGHVDTSDPFLADSDHVKSAIDRRCTAIKYFSYEILSCYISDQRHRIQEYTTAFFPTQGTENKSGIVLCDFLDMLSFDTKMPTIKTVWSYFQPDVYYILLHDETIEASHRLSLALTLQKSMLLKKADDREKTLINAEYLALIEYLTIYKRVELRKEAIRKCLTEWSKLVVVIFHSLLKDVPYVKVVARELLHILLVKLPSIQETDHELADTLCEAIVSTTYFTSEDRIEQLMHFFKSILVCLQSPASTQHQRECLYLAGSGCLQVINTHWQDESTKSSMASIAKAGIDRYLTIICRDTVAHEAVVRISACIFLDLMLRTCEQMSNPILSQRIVSLNLFARFAHHFELSLNTDTHTDAVDQQFDVVLRLAMTRPGAQELTQNPALLNALAQKYFTLNDGSEDASNAIRLLRIYVACIVSLGAQMSFIQKLLSKFANTWLEKLSSHLKRMEIARNAKLEEFQDLLEVLGSSRQK